MQGTNPISAFIRSDAGAVTVDWVVLTAAVTGLGLAVMGAVSTGAQSASNATASTLSGITIKTAFETLGDLFGTDFSGGADGWTGGTVADVPGFGEMLLVDPGGTAELALDVPDGAETLEVAFDLIGGDDLDGEPATVYVNGQPVAVYADDHGRITVSGEGAEGVTVSIDQQYRNDPVGGGTHGSDSRATVRITIDDPGQGLTLGVGSGADEGLGNEFYGVDDVSVTAS
ncbi:hypothetical protein JQC91_14560 [Jannaschia sp. Os4]|uniref:hypothetical protein n=1 Tax=Jannaschia sp. Os4 TaxID=2807617 RepID=UPI001939D8BE|nr:hypothetical protein [Jannaschia sp. Os4]MBM2577527.1 hypothetical protein [Jannaschia sp. Os4]